MNTSLFNRGEAFCLPVFPSSQFQGTNSVLNFGYNLHLLHILGLELNFLNYLMAKDTNEK